MKLNKLLIILAFTLIGVFIGGCSSDENETSIIEEIKDAFIDSTSRAIVETVSDKIMDTLEDAAPMPEPRYSDVSENTVSGNNVPDINPVIHN